MRLLLIRHPKPDVPEGLCYGRTDVPADAQDFESLVARLRARWATGTHPRPDAVYTSPLQRCERVARALADDVWPAPVVDARLMEMDFGDWEGRRWPEIPRDELDAWRANVVENRAPGGESVGLMSARAGAFAGEHLGEDRHGPDSLVVLMTHAGIIQTLPHLLREIPFGQFKMGKLDYGTITTLTRRGGRFELESHNVAP